MTLTERGVILGAGTLLAKLDDKALPIEADQERIWTLLSVAYGEEISLVVFGSLRRWQNTGTAATRVSAAIYLAQMGLPDIGEDAAYRLSLAAELIDAGIAPREIARELGLPRSSLRKQIRSRTQPRVPAGSGAKVASGRRAMPRNCRPPERVPAKSTRCPNSPRMHRRHAAGWNDDRRSKVPKKEAHGAAACKFQGGLRGWRTDCKLAVNATN